MICLNDPTDDIEFEMLSKELQSAFETILPEKCLFEKQRRNYVRTWHYTLAVPTESLYFVVENEKENLQDWLLEQYKGKRRYGCKL